MCAALALNVPDLPAPSREGGLRRPSPPSPEALGVYLLQALESLASLGAGGERSGQRLCRREGEPRGSSGPDPPVERARRADSTPVLAHGRGVAALAPTLEIETDASCDLLEGLVMDKALEA